MVKAREIRDEASLGAWLEGRPPRDVRSIGTRLATRVAPFALKTPDRSNAAGYSPVLPALRVLVSIVAGSTRPSAANDRSIEAAILYLNGSDYFRMTPARSIISVIIDLASAVRGQNAATIVFSVSRAIRLIDAMVRTEADFSASRSDVTTATFAFWESIREDARLLEAGGNPLLSPLWSPSAPRYYIGMEQNFLADWRADDAYAFWIVWWEGINSGRQLPWDLQARVALIPNGIWEQGTEAVAREIALIEEQLRLQGEVARLRSELEVSRAQVATFATRSHNNPPELVDHVSELAGEVDEASEALRATDVELERGAPRPAVLRKAGRALVNAAARTLAYCASLGDAALKKAAEEVGSYGAKAVIGAGLLAWVSQWEAVLALGRALEAFAKALVGG